MKLAAFTLIEIVVALAVLSIVTALTYNGFSYLAQSTRGYIDNTSAHLELMGFTSRLEADLAQANTVQQREDGALHLAFYDDSEIIYEFESGQLLRKSEGRKDSIAAQAMELGFVSQKEDFTGDVLVQEISISALLFDQIMPLYFFKEYHATQYLERL